MRDRDALSLLTVEGIATWLERHVGGRIDVQSATVADALQHDLPRSFVAMSESHSVCDAREAFMHAIVNSQPRLFAIVITSDGTRRGEPIGIVTPWDLMKAPGG